MLKHKMGGKSFFMSMTKTKRDIDLLKVALKVSKSEYDYRKSKGPQGDMEILRWGKRVNDAMKSIKEKEAWIDEMLKRKEMMK